MDGLFLKLARSRNVCLRKLPINKPPPPSCPPTQANKSAYQISRVKSLVREQSCCPPACNFNFPVTPKVFPLGCLFACLSCELNSRKLLVVGNHCCRSRLSARDTTTWVELCVNGFFLSLPELACQKLTKAKIVHRLSWLQLAKQVACFLTHTEQASIC